MAFRKKRPKDPRRVAVGKRAALAPIKIPPCAASMGCLCAGHARGNSADAPCDTREYPWSG